MLVGGRRLSFWLAGLLLLVTGFVDEALAQRATSDLPLPPGAIISGPIFRRDGTFVPEIETGANANTYLNVDGVDGARSRHRSAIEWSSETNHMRGPSTCKLARSVWISPRECFRFTASIPLGEWSSGGNCGAAR
jgi:hypothetical protein